MGDNDSINPKVQESFEENNHKFPQIGISTSKEDFEAHENLQQLVVVVPNENLVELDFKPECEDEEGIMDWGVAFLEYSTRERWPTQRFIDFFDLVEHGVFHSSKPTTFKEALANEDVNKWKLTMDEEYQSLIKNNTYSSIKLPTNQNMGAQSQ
jgi:hypothetical protein